MTEIERLETRFKQMRAEGLRDFKIQLSHDFVPNSCSVEELAEELNAMLDADERGDYVDISDKLR
jgi:hypothetical protein